MRVPIPKLKICFGSRHIQFFMLFLSLFIAFGIRTNISVAILAMISKNPPNTNIPTYPHWTEKETILSAFFWGYVIPQIFVGALVLKFGSKWFLVVSSLFNSLFTILIPPMAASFGETGVIVCRVLDGLSQSILYPSIHNLLGKWAPTPELSRVASFIYTGGPLGVVVGLPITGLISDSYVGWPVVFYLYGALGIVWAVVWAFVGADSPVQHRSISQKEKLYIEKNTRTDPYNKTKATPWKSIFTSVPVLAIIIAQCAQNWGFWTLMSEIPTYMNSILKYNLTKDSLLSALPYFVLWLLSFVFSYIADFLIGSRIMSTTNVRKVFHIISAVIPAIALVVLAFSDTKNKTIVLVLVVAAVGFNAGVYCASLANLIDLSPNHAGVIMGITNSISNIFSILAPLALKVIPYQQDDPILWRYVFCIAAGIYVVASLFYILFASAEVQPWNEEPKNSENSLENMHYSL